MDAGYAHRSDEVELTSFAHSIKNVFQEFIFMAAIASNQSGVARGIYGISEFESFTKALIKKIDPNEEFFFMAVACPHLPDENCECRKPKTAMLEVIKLENKFKNVIMIGNSTSDEVAAKKADMFYLNCNIERAAKKFTDWLELYSDHK
jgi:D-glycero-D-manno-heptose 1,7-bisphosphate phosphatase